MSYCQLEQCYYPIVASRARPERRKPDAELVRFLIEVFPERYSTEHAAESADCVQRLLLGQGLMASLSFISEFDR